MLHAIRASRADNLGTIAMMTALVAPVIMAGLAIGVDVAYWRYRTGMLQSAADMAAVSLAVDLSNNVLAPVTLAQNARNEVRKHGCGEMCNVTIQYPFNGSPQAVQVTVSDGADRFFSWMYENTDRTLTGRASARVSNGTSANRQGSSCILALSPSATNALNFIGSLGTGTNSVIAGCEAMVNSNNNTAVLAQGNATMTSLVTTPGGIGTVNGGLIPLRNTPGPVQADPYYNTFNALGSVYRKDQFRVAYGSTGGFNQDECIDYVLPSGARTAYPIDWSKDLTTATGIGSLPFQAARGYSTSIGPDGRRVHNLGGGGGRFCADFLATNVVLNFGPGAYYFNGDVKFEGTTVNAISTTPTTMAPVIMLPRAGGQITNGITLIRGPGTNVQFQSGSDLHLRAPTIGPFSGVAIASHPDAGNGGGNYTMGLYNDSTVEWSGLIYAPFSMLHAQNGNLRTLPGPNGTEAGGCIQIVAWTLTIGRSSVFGNQCAGMGLQAWGTDNTQGWLVSPNTAGVRGRLFTP